MPDENTSTNEATQPAAEKVAKKEIVMLPLPDVTLPVTRFGDKTIELTPRNFGKKGDRKGQIYFAPKQDYFQSPEGLKSLEEFLGPKFFAKVIDNWFRAKAQQLDNIATEKGKEQLDYEELQEFWQEMSTRGEKVGELKQLHDLLLQFFKRVSDLKEGTMINAQTLTEVYNAINDEATKAHAEKVENCEDEDEAEKLQEAGPVLLDESFIENLNSFVTTMSNNPVYAPLPKDVKNQVLVAATFNQIGEQMKVVQKKIDDNSKPRRKKRNKGESSAEGEETSEDVGEGQQQAA